MLETQKLVTWRIDPLAISDFNRDDHALELMVLFCMCVANKRAPVIAEKVENFLLGSGYAGSPFDKVRMMVRQKKLRAHLERVKMGKYTTLEPGMTEITRRGAFNLRTCTAEDLEQVHGIGMKTSRYFLLHSRAGASLGVIDTHMLKYLRSIGIERVPDASPTGEEYIRLELAILQEAGRLGMDFAEFDLKVWTWYSERNKGPLLLEPAVPAAA